MIVRTRPQLVDFLSLMGRMESFPDNTVHISVLGKLRSCGILPSKMPERTGSR